MKLSSRQKRIAKAAPPFGGTGSEPTSVLIP